MPYLTPNFPAPTATICRRLRIPADRDIDVIFHGALLALCAYYAWEQYGSMTPGQAAAMAMEVERDAWSSEDWCMVGAVIPFATASLPPHTLLCDGSVHLRVDFPALYAALDPSFIVDADHFTVPDLRGNVILGTDVPSGGTYPIGATGGEAQHTLTLAEIAAHSHTDSGHAHAYIPAGPNATTIGPGAPQPTAVPSAGFTGNASANLSTDGGGGPHNNLQPYLALRYCIISE